MKAKAKAFVKPMKAKAKVAKPMKAKAKESVKPMTPKKAKKSVKPMTAMKVNRATRDDAQIVAAALRARAAAKAAAKASSRGFMANGIVFDNAADHVPIGLPL